MGDPNFLLKAEDGECFVIQYEKQLLKEIFSTDGGLSAPIGQESFAVLQFAYNIGGTEAVCESFHSVMDVPTKTGRQTNETRSLRSVVDWNLPNVLAYPIAQMPYPV